MEKSYKLNFIICLALSALVVISGACYEYFGGLWLKGLTSLGFVVIGFLGLFYVLKNNSKTKKYAIIMFVGLFLCMIADIVLNIEFIIGALIFALGHVCYFIAYCSLIKFNKLDVIVCSVFAVISSLIVALVPIFDFGGIIMEIVCVFYAIIISFMCGKAICNYVKNRNIANLIIAIGCVLFFFSDLMLLFECFAGGSRIFDILCLYSYYPAQCLLGLSIILKSKTN